MSSHSEALCQSCGFCCDGTLFAVVPLHTTPFAGERLGLRVLSRPDGSRVLEQPCAALTGAGCTIYRDRPTPCRAYRCNLLIALEETEVSLEEAKELVERVRTLTDQIAAALPTEAPGERKSLRHRAHAVESLPSAIREDLARWESLLTNHFRGRRG